MLQASPSCPSHPSCNLNTMLHTYFWVWLYMYAHTIVGLTRARNHAKQGEWDGRVHPPRGPSWGFWLKNPECKCTQQWRSIHTHTLVVFCVVSNYKSTYLQYMANRCPVKESTTVNFIALWCKQFCKGLLLWTSLFSQFHNYALLLTLSLQSKLNPNKALSIVVPARIQRWAVFYFLFYFLSHPFSPLSIQFLSLLSPPFFLSLPLPILNHFSISHKSRSILRILSSLCSSFSLHFSSNSFSFIYTSRKSCSIHCILFSLSFPSIDLHIFSPFFKPSLSCNFTKSSWSWLVDALSKSDKTGFLLSAVWRDGHCYFEIELRIWMVSI